MIQPPSDPNFRLLPHRIDWLAEHASCTPYARYPKSSQDLTAGFETVTFYDLAAAIDRAAWWLKSNLKSDEQCFAYCGPSDLRWSILVVAAIKTGKTMIHVSPWACTEGLFDFLSQWICTVVIYDEQENSDALATSPITSLFAQSTEFRLLAVPSLSDALNRFGPPVPRYEYNKTWAQAADEPVAIFQTSQITETSDSIVWSNRKITTWQSMLELARRDPSVLVPDLIGKTIFTTLMPAHVEGHNFQLFMPLFFTTTIVLRDPAQDLNPKTIYEIMRRSSCTGIIATPGVLYQLTQNPRALALLRSLESIVVASAGLPQECNDLLQHPGLTIQTIYGRDEAFPCIQKRGLTRDSRYVRFHETSGITFSTHPSGLLEPTTPNVTQHLDTQPPSTAISNTKPFHTGDLFSIHPSLPDHYTFHRHTAYTITLTHGQQLNPSATEDTISAHPLIKSALIHGTHRPRPLLIIEPFSDTMTSLARSPSQQPNFVNEIWPTVEEANSSISPACHLSRDLTLVLTMPFVRDSNGDIDRAWTESLIKDEIEAVYTAYDQPVPEPVPREIDMGIARLVRGFHNNAMRNARVLQVFREVMRS